MTPYPNLVSNSILINETIALLRSLGGSATPVDIVDTVMCIREPAPDLARMLVEDLVEADPRLAISEGVVELVSPNGNEKTLAETEFVVFDLETTGAKAPPCRVTEIGAYRMVGSKIVDEFQTLVNPDMPIPTFISELTGITDEMVGGAPRFREVLKRFLDFVGESILVAHNARFDMRFLNHEIQKIHSDYRIANTYLCTVRLARRLVKGIPNHRLKTLAEHFQVALVNHHRAAEDAKATAEIFGYLLEELENRGVKNLAAARSLAF